MDFIFHSVYDDEGRTKYFSVYRVDDTHFRAECHHFNRSRLCDGDFELVKEGENWKPSSKGFENEAQFIGAEIDRMVHSDDKS